MQFKFPQHVIGANIWFLSGEDRLIYGAIDMCTIVMKGEEGIAIYYGVIDDKKNQHTVKESQVLDNTNQVKSPKYNVNDEVAYEYKDKDGRAHFDTGTITVIRMVLEEGTMDTQYIFDDNFEYWASEDEILGHADSTWKEANGDTN